MNFWKRHVYMRLGLMILCFALGILLVLAGWKMTGQLEGLGLMLLGILGMLMALWLYNRAHR